MKCKLVDITINRLIRQCLFRWKNKNGIHKIEILNLRVFVEEEKKNQESTEFTKMRRLNLIKVGRK